MRLFVNAQLSHSVWPSFVPVEDVCVRVPTVWPSRNGFFHAYASKPTLVGSHETSTMLRTVALVGAAASASAFSSTFTPAPATLASQAAVVPARRALRTSVKMELDGAAVLAAAPGLVALGALLGQKGDFSGNLRADDAWGSATQTVFTVIARGGSLDASECVCTTDGVRRLPLRRRCPGRSRGRHGWLHNGSQPYHPS